MRIIEAPTPPAKRSNPPLLLIAGSIVAAILIAGATVFVLSSLRETFLSPQEVERALGVPVLSAPIMGDGAPAARDHGRLVAAIDALGLRGGVALLLLSPNSRASLQASALGIGRALVRRAPGAVMLVRFAEGAPIPASADAIEIETIEGMATGVIGLDACAAGHRDAPLLAGLKTRYAYVIVTAPPTAAAFESIELARSVDAVVPVVEAEVTRRPTMRAMLTQVGDIGGRVLGAAMIGRRSHIPVWLYRLAIERSATTG